MQMWHLLSKKKDQSNVENYGPISILPIFSKVYERCMYDQMYEYFNKILSKQQCGFRQGFSTQHCLLAMTEKWRKYLYKYWVSGALLTDLSKAFDCLLHDIWIAKLAAYGLDYPWRWYKVIFWIDNKELKLIILTALFLTLYSEFLKVQY